MNLSEFSEKYQDLVFAPLGIPEVPVDSELLAEWCSGAVTLLQEYSGIYDDDELYKQLQIHYGTKNIFGMTSGYTVTDRLPNGDRQYKQSFLKYFPDFPAWLGSMPFVSDVNKIHVVVLKQTLDFMKKYNCPPYGPIHFDQPGQFGLRLWVNNTKNRMMMIPRKQPFSSMPDADLSPIYNDVLHQKDSDNNLVTTSEGYPVPNQEFHNIHLNTSSPHTSDFFIMNEDTAAHMVMPELGPDEQLVPEKEKFTFLLLTYEPDKSLNWSEMDRVLQRCYEKHSEHFVWMPK